MIHTLKRSSLALSSWTGLSNWVAGTGWRQRRLLILCYHGVSLDDEHQWNPELYVSPAHLERRMAILRRNGCHVLPLGEAVERLSRDALPERAVVLTFDDGYHDYMVRARPILDASGYPATVYLTTARVDHNYPVVGLFVSYLLWRARDRRLAGEGLPGLDAEYALADANVRRTVLARMTAALRPMSAGAKDAVAAELAARLGFDYQQLLASRVLTLMRPDDVRTLSSAGVDFQLHTHLHRSPADSDVFVRDVQRNRARITEMTGIVPEHLCYPSGEYHPSYPAALAGEHLRSATTCDPGLATRHAHRLLLPRLVDTSHVGDIEFEAWVTGVATCLPRRTRRAHPAYAAG